MKQTEVNYSPLKKIKKQPAILIYVALAIVFITGGLIAAMYYSYTVPLGYTFMLWCIVGIPSSAIYAQKKLFQYQDKLWQNFGRANGWQITKGDENFLPPVLASLGRRRKISSIVKANIEGIECNLFAYKVTVDYGKAERTYVYTIATITMPKPFPHLILDSTHSFTILNNKGTATEKVKLEGNFNKYFKLRYAPDEHIDALSIITPDVMQTLIKSTQYQDVEIIGNRVYFMSSSDDRSAAVLPTLVQSVVALNDELTHKARSLNYKADTGAVEAKKAMDSESMRRVVYAIGFAVFIVLIGFTLALIYNA